MYIHTPIHTLYIHTHIHTHKYIYKDTYIHTCPCANIPCDKRIWRQIPKIAGSSL